MRGASSEGDDAVPHVASSISEREPPLPRKLPPPAQQVYGGHAPASAERAREGPRGDVAAPQRPLGIAWHVRDGVDAERRQDLEHERRRLFCEPPPAVLLPLADEDPGTLVVDDRRACTGEREPAARAFGAPPDGPRPGGPHRSQTGPRTLTSAPRHMVAERRSGRRADGAALRQEQPEHLPIVGGYSLRLCEKMRSASWSVSAEPMSYHSPGSRQV